MSESVTRVLLVEDEASDVHLIEAMIAEAGAGQFEVEAVSRLSDGLARLSQGGVNVTLLDLGLPDCEGLQTLTTVTERFPAQPILVFTGLEAEWLGLQAVQRGAQDYLVKGRVDGPLLVRAVRYAIERQQMIMEQRQYVQRLKTSHLRMQGILEQNADAILLINRKGLIFYLNPAARELLGAQRGDRAQDALGVRIEGPMTREIDVRRPGAGRATAEVRVVEVDWDGEPAFLATLRDITERANMQEVLQEAAGEWQHTFDAVEDMMVVIDRQHRVLRANRAARQGLGAEHILGRACYELFHGSGGHPDSCPSCATFQTGKAAHVERQERHLDNRWLDMASYPIKDKQGEVVKVVHVVRDITERKQSEQMQRTLDAKNLVVQELQEINEMKGQFIEVVSHELRTPMTVIRSGVTLLLDRSLGELSDKQERFLEVIERNIDRLARFAGDVLSLSRLDSGKYRLLPRKLTLGEMLGSTVALLGTRAAEEGFTLELPDEEALALPVYADPDAVSQVLTNLVTNVLMHCPRGTEMRLSARRLDAERVELVLADDGPGIAAEDLGLIFQRFHQSARRSGPGYRGTGVGLAVCKTLVERMDGTITVDSSPGQGTTFTLTLPVDTVDEEVLFGKLAVIHRLVQPADLRRATEQQRRHGEGAPLLGELLVQAGAMDEGQVEEVLKRQRTSLGRPHAYLPFTVGQALLGQMALKYGYLTEAQVNRAVLLHQSQREEGLDVRLGEVLVEEGLLTADELVHLLRLQKRVIAACPRCGNQYNILSSEHHRRHDCLDCGEALVVCDDPRTVAVEGDA